MNEIPKTSKHEVDKSFIDRLTEKIDDFWEYAIKIARPHRTSATIVAVIVLTIFTWWWWGTRGINLFKDVICAEKKDCSATLSALGQTGDIFGGINAIFAALAMLASIAALISSKQSYQKDRQLSHDAEYTKQVQKSYEWAYETLTEGSSKELTRDESKWKYAARHISRTRTISSKIESQVYRLILDEHVDYWQNQFKRLLSIDPGMGPYFFATDDRHQIVPGTYEKIARISPSDAKIIGVFAYGSLNDIKPQKLEHMGPEETKKAIPSHFGEHLGEYMKKISEQEKKVRIADKSKSPS